MNWSAHWKILWPREKVDAKRLSPMLPVELYNAHIRSITFMIGIWPTPSSLGLCAGSEKKWGKGKRTEDKEGEEKGERGGGLYSFQLPDEERPSYDERGATATKP